MVAGIVISTVQAVMWYVAPASDPCDGGRLTRETESVKTIMWCSAIMYGSYFFLFFQFYLARYVTVAINEVKRVSLKKSVAAKKSK
jgi:hypothetical protein